jgi:menaquinol-cytochrome c reductase iron-sulfur subunit
MNREGSYPPPEDRRGFLKHCCAGLVGGALALVPIGAGLGGLLAPLRRGAGGAQAIRVTTLDALPADGVPRKFPVIAERIDAWTTYPPAPIGAVYLRRTSDTAVEALNVACPHAGCYVDFSATTSTFHCPCHNSAFTVDGKVTGPSSPAPRPLDSLAVEVRNGKEVWVTFQNFQTGRTGKIPVA